MKRTIIIAGTAVALLAACSSSDGTASTPAATAVATTASTSTPSSSSSPTPEASSTPPVKAPPRITPGMKAPAVAKALGCTKVTAKKVKKSSVGPTAASEAYCTLGGKVYLVATWKTEDDLTEALVIIKAFLAGSIRKPFTLGVGDQWSVTRSKDISSLGADMAKNVKAVGGVIKTVKPSSEL